MLRIEHDGPLSRIVFAAPKGLNVISSALLTELDAAWTQLESSDARVCIIRGEGKAFLAGADIKEMAQFDADGAREFSARGQGVLSRIEESLIVSIAALHGPCLGGGCELALACDIRVGAAGMSIGQPEVALGLIPGFGGTQRLPRIVGPAWALRMILAGEPLDEARALQIGLITDSGPAETLAERADTLARTILSRGPEAVRLAKKITRHDFAGGRDSGMRAECFTFGKLFENGEAKEGLSAFTQKRPPKF